MAAAWRLLCAVPLVLSVACVSTTRRHLGAEERARTRVRATLRVREHQPVRLGWWVRCAS